MLYFCIKCQKLTKKYIKVINKHEIQFCRLCNHGITRINDGYNIKRFNKNHYNKVYLANYLNSENLYINRFLLCVKRIDQIINGGNLLDVGCNVGTFLMTIKKYSCKKWNLFGIDINSLAIRIAKNRLNAHLQTKDVESCEFSKNYFNLVSMFDILEHVKDPHKNLWKINFLLKKDGILVLQVPNHRSVMRYLCQNNWDWWSIPDHLQHYSKRSIELELKHSHYKILFIDTWQPKKDFIQNICGTIKSSYNYSIFSKLYSKIIYYLLMILWPIYVILEKKFQVGGLIFVIAQKI